MGYRSDFEVTWQDGAVPVSAKAIAEKLTEITKYDFEVDTDNIQLHDAKWYEIASNLGDFTKAMPYVKLSVWQKGKDGAESIYDVYDGKVDYRLGTIEFEPRTLWEDAA